MAGNTPHHAEDQQIEVDMAELAHRAGRVSAGGIVTDRVGTHELEVRPLEQLPGIVGLALDDLLSQARRNS